MPHFELLIDEKYPGFNPIQFGWENCSPGHSFGPAVRTFYLLHYVISGTGYFERGGARHAVKEGEIFVIPPLVQTFYESDQDNPWSYIWIGFETSGIILPDLPPILRITAASDLFLQMQSAHLLGNGKSAFLSGKLWELYSLLLEEAKSKEPTYIEKAIHQMNAEYMNGIKIDALARMLHLDRSYFCNLFKQETGQSPQEYLTHLRLSKAAELMTLYSQSPSTAAASTGYSDIYSFSKMFRKKYSLSPREYIKEYHRKTQTDHL